MLGRSVVLTKRLISDSGSYFSQSLKSKGILKENVKSEAEFVRPIPTEVLTVFWGEMRQPEPMLRTAEVDSPLDVGDADSQ
jgi:hypothetical protein